MATSWPKKPRLIGTKVQRLDGPDKSTGRARYSFDINRKGMLHAIMLRSPHAHARIVSLDASAAEKMPGVRAIHLVSGEGKQLYYAGDEILAIAADTEEHARDAVRAVKIKYELLPFLVKEEDALHNAEVKTVAGAAKSNVTFGAEFVKGDPETGLKQAAVVVEGFYGVPVICHQCLESHGLVAEWEGDNLTVWASTQAVTGTAAALAQFFKARVPNVNAKCITHYMGGGFGSKFGPDIQGIVAAELALKAKAAVKLMLDRADEITVGGNRPSAYGTIKIAGAKDGTITAYEVDCYGTPGERGGATVNLAMLPYVYADTIPNFKRRHVVVRTNAGAARAMRAPGHPQNCVLTDGPLDDLAAQLGLDPMEVRLKNLPHNDPKAAQNDPLAWLGQRENVYRAEIAIAAKISGWKKKWHPPGKGPGKDQSSTASAWHYTPGAARRSATSAGCRPTNAPS